MSKSNNNTPPAASSNDENSLLGPSYPYYKFIKTPKELGMSTKGDLSTVGKDLIGLTEYVKVMVVGDSKASKTGKPLGNKFFLKSGGKCTDVKTGQEVDRYIYINNIPTGNIPFISGGLGVNFTDFRGLIPGTLEQLNNFNPVTLWHAFTAGPKPNCQELTMDIIDINNNKTSETHYVTLVDIQDMDNCIFPSKRNPVTGARCKETFGNMEHSYNTSSTYTTSSNYSGTNIDSNTSSNSGFSTEFNTPLVKEFAPSLPSDINSKIYMASVGILGVYVSYKALQKMKLIPQ